jgi:hypothetical protein
MPTNDAKLIYDFDNHRYILNHEGNGEHLNIAKAYGSIENIKANLRSISRTIYNFIYFHNHTLNRNYVEYLLATDVNFRNVMYEAMLSQLLADVESGVDSVKNQSGINLETGGIISRSDRISNMISIETEMILRNSNGSQDILFMGDRGYRLPEERYAIYGY